MKKFTQSSGVLPTACYFGRYSNLAVVVPLLCSQLLCSQLFAAAPADSPFGPATPGISGQLRPRTELNKKGFTDSLDPVLSTHLRTRLSYTAIPSEKLTAKVELQDTRFFGSEGIGAGATVSNLKGLDLLQGYAVWNPGPLSLALGRQKMSLGSGRFLSTLEWHPYSRAFDGLSAYAPLGGGDLTALMFTVSDSTTTLDDDYAALYGIHYAHPLPAGLVAEGYAFYDHSDVGNPKKDLLYVGERLTGKAGPVFFEEEFILQSGDVKDTTSFAYQLALRVGSSFGAHKATIGVDMMSGDDDLSDKDGSTYIASYYFGHAYFGWMDYFLTNPGDGLIDIRADLALSFGMADIKPQYHYFMPANAASGMDDSFGQEFDIEVLLKLDPKIKLAIGGGVFIPGESANRIGAGLKTKAEPGYMVYVMPIIGF